MRWLIATFGIFAIGSQASGQVPPQDLRLRFEINVPERVLEVKLSETRMAYLLADGDVMIRERENGELIHVARHNGPPVRTIALSDDGEWLAMGGAREVISPPARTLKNFTPHEFKFSNLDDVPPLITQSEVRLRRWSYETPQLPPSTQTQITTPIALGGVVSVRRSRNGSELRQRSDFSDEITALSLDGSKVTVIQGEFNVVTLNEKMIVTFAYKNNMIQAPMVYPHSNFSFAKDGKLFVSLVDGADGIVHMFLFESEESLLSPIVRRTKSSPPWAVTLSSDGRRMVAACQSGDLRIWNVQEGGVGYLLKDERIKPVNLKYVSFGEHSDKLITYGDDGMVRIWNVTTGRVFFSTKGPSRDVRIASLQNDRLLLISGAYHSTNGSVDPLVIETINVKPNMTTP